MFENTPSGVFFCIFDALKTDKSDFMTKCAVFARTGNRLQSHNRRRRFGAELRMISAKRRRFGDFFGFAV